MQQQIIPEGYRQILSRLVASGAFVDEDAALKHAFELLVDEQQAEDDQSAAPALSAEEWTQRFQRLIDRHRPTGFPLDDSRESMYPDRC